MHFVYPTEEIFKYTDATLELLVLKDIDQSLGVLISIFIVIFLKSF